LTTPSLLSRGTRKFKNKFKNKITSKTNQPQDELPEWYHQRRDEVNSGKYGRERAGHPPRNTLQEKVDQLEGVENTQRDTTKKGGYRISTEKSKQDLKHGLRQIKSKDDLQE
jgi:hypothetical protein